MYCWLETIFLNRSKFDPIQHARFVQQGQPRKLFETPAQHTGCTLQRLWQRTAARDALEISLDLSVYRCRQCFFLVNVAYGLCNDSGGYLCLFYFTCFSQNSSQTQETNQAWGVFVCILSCLHHGCDNQTQELQSQKEASLRPKMPSLWMVDGWTLSF